MSNVYKTNLNNEKKVIKLRPIERKKHSTIVHGVSSEEQLTTIEQKIEQANIKLHQLQQKHEEVVQMTKDEVRNEKEQWEHEKELLVSEAKQLGYNEGFAKGETDSLLQYKDKIIEANNIIKTATKDYEMTIDKSKDTIIELALFTAEKVINQHIDDDPETFQAIVETAIKTIKTDKKISVYVHPNQFDFLIKQKDELMNNIDGQAQLEIYIDKNLLENSCIIEHPFGQVDASIDTQLEQIRSVLQNVSNGE